MMLMAMRVLSARTNMVIIRLAGDGHDDPNFKDHDDPNLKDHNDPNFKDHDDHLQVLEEPGT